MKFIRPIEITDANFVSSSIVENDYTLWNATTNYELGSLVRRETTHKTYENLIAGVNSTLPENTLADLAPRWLETGPTNRWAMFDDQIGTSSLTGGALSVVVSPGRINSVALLEIAASTAEVFIDVGAERVYSSILNLNEGNEVRDWYEYFFEPVYEQDSLVLTDLPMYSDGVLTVNLIRSGGQVSCGVLVVGLYVSLGNTQYSPSIGITDYSRKEIDDFGNPTIVKRKYSKRMSTTVTLSPIDVDNVTKELAKYRSTPVVWVGAGSIYTSMIIYGFYKDWDMTIDNSSEASLSLQVEGMV